MTNLFQIPTTRPRTVTERFEKYLSKDLLYDLLAITKDPIVFYDKEYGYTACNNAFLKLFSFEHIDDFLQYHQSLRDLFFTQSEDLSHMNERQWLEHLANKEKELHVSIRLESGVRRFALDVSYLSSSSNLLAITLRERTEEAKAQEKAKELEHLKTKFLADISHEFRTPMNGIFGFSELLSQTELDRLQRSYLSMIERSSKALMSSVEALLDLSQIQNKQLKLEYGWSDILRLLEKKVEFYSQAAHESGKKMYAFLDPLMARTYMIDVEKFEQIIEALLQHSLEATQNRGKIFFFFRRSGSQTRGTCNLTCEIKHNGKGLTKEEIDSIRNPFGEHANYSMGIGLALASELLKLLGAKLEIFSDIATGTTFSFTLHLRAGEKRVYEDLKKMEFGIALLDDSKAEAAKIFEHYLRYFGMHINKVTKEELLDSKQNFMLTYVFASTKEYSWLREIPTQKSKASFVFVQTYGPKLPKAYAKLFRSIVSEPFIPSLLYEHLRRVGDAYVPVPEEKPKKEQKSIYALIVEDNLINQKLLDRVLRDRGIKTAIASDGEEAVAKCNQEKYDIIFMDIDMPRMDGISATREIKAHSEYNKSTPIVALTAKALSGDKETLLLSGLDDYMSKPLRQEKLQRVLDQYFS